MYRKQAFIAYRLIRYDIGIGFFFFIFFIAFGFFLTKPGGGKKT